MPESPIEFLRFVHLRGPNIWTYRPVLEAWVDIGDLEDCPSDSIPGFPERLAALLPGLVDHRCSYGERGGFLRRLVEGTWPAHIMEHVTLELQYLAGMPGGFGRARSTAKRGVYKVTVRAWHEDITRTAFHLGRDLLLAAMAPQTYGPCDVSAAVTTLHGMADALLLGSSTQSIVDAATAKDRRIPAIRLNAGNLVQLGYGARARRIRTVETDATPATAVVEVNAGTSLIMHLKPAAGEARPVGRAIVDHLFPLGDLGRIPVIGIAGSRGTTPVARLIAWLLRRDGRQVGLACSQGLFLGTQCIDPGDCAHWDPAQRLLVNPTCEVAVIENGRDAMLFEGLAYDRCQVGVLTNIDPTLLPDDGYVDSPERLCALMRTQVDVVLPGGAAVLNAADPLVAEMASLSDGEVIFFAADPAHPVVLAHRAAGGRALTLSAGRVMLGQGGHETAVAELRVLPWTRAGTCPHQVDNLIAAVAAAWALDLSPEQIREGIAGFDPGAGWSRA
jgi:hypothetical protein